MRALLDTHVWLWMLTAPERLGAARELLARADTELLLSAASTWEIALKYTSGRLPLPEPPDRYLPPRLRSTRVELLAISHQHTLAVANLPPVHRDPFDRLLVAQAQALKVPLITADETLSGYDLELLQIG